jgi:hypothetical protein
MSRAPIAVAAPGNTGPESKVIAWTGLAIDPRDSTVYSAANGGHWDYGGNEVDSIRLSDNAPAWVERRASSAASQIRTDATHYGDGRPTSRHTYYGILASKSRNRVMVMSGAAYGNGILNRAMDGFNLSTNDWDAEGTYPNVPTGITMLAAPFIEHESTGDIWALANYDVYRWTSSSGAWTRVIAGNAVYGYEAASALDTRRNRVLVLGGGGDDRGLYTLGGSSMQSASLSGQSGSVGGDGNGMVYDPWLDAYLLKRSSSGGTVFRINAQTFAVDSLPTTGGGSIPGAVNGVYRRFLFAPQLGGVVYCPTYNGNLWFLRTS